jgi:hypothetical protein
MAVCCSLSEGPLKEEANAVGFCSAASPTRTRVYLTFVPWQVNRSLVMVIFQSTGFSAKSSGSKVSNSSRNTFPLSFQVPVAVAGQRSVAFSP